MKRLSDYQGEAAIELWADLLDPVSEILSDPDVANVVNSGESKLKMVQVILKSHSEAATKILLMIDPEPVTGLNIIVRLMGIIVEIGENPEVSAFFGFAGQVKMDGESSGSVTENTEAEEI